MVSKTNHAAARKKINNNNNNQCLTRPAIMALWAVQSSLFLLYSTFLHVCSSFIRYFYMNLMTFLWADVSLVGKIPEGIFLNSLLAIFFSFLHFLQLCKQNKDQNGYCYMSLCCKVVVFYINGRTPYYKLLCF